MSSRGIPEVLMKKVDEYVDSLGVQIQPRITSELEDFQEKTIDVLETQVVDAFRSLFDKNGGGGGGSSSRSLDNSAPDAYGGQSLPFADEISKLTRSFTKISGEASSDLRDIFDLTEGQGGGPGETRSRGGDPRGGSSSGAKGFLSAAFNVVQDHLESSSSSSSKGSGGQGFKFDGLLGVLSDTVKDASRNPEEKARLISPEIKEKVGAKLRMQHASIAEQFTRIALDHIKRWLRGNLSTRDIGDGARGEVEDQVKGLVKGLGSLLGSKKPAEGTTSRSVGDRSDRADGEESESSGGFSGVISTKLSTGLGKVHREVRLEFRKVLGGIEKELFELLPDEFQRPLEKILGGNPFDEKLDRDAGGSQRDRGFGDDIKTKLLSKIRDLVRKVQETLRESILRVVNGGHRKFERQSWVFVQSMVEQKVQKYLPKVKITVPDDIGNEGVSVGAPASSSHLGGSQSGPPPSQGGQASSPIYELDGGQGVQPGKHSSSQQGGGRVSPPSQQQHSGQGHGQQGYSPPSQYPPRQDGRPDYPQEKQDYRPQQHQSQQEQRPMQSRPPRNDSPPQSYQSNQRPDHQQGQGYQQDQGYQSPSHQQSQGYQQSQSYQQQQGHQQSPSYQQGQGYQQQQGHQQNQGYQQGQGYRRDEGLQQDQGYRRDEGLQQDQGYQQSQRYDQNQRY